MRLSELIKYLDEIAPFSIQEDWDNSGLLVGSLNSEVNSVVCCLDVTEELVDFAEEHGINTIISHHPFIFKGIKSIDYDSKTGKIFKRIISGSYNVIALHTNLDKIKYGVSYVTCRKLGYHAEDIAIKTDDGYGYGVVFKCDCKLSLIAKKCSDIFASAVVWGGETQIKKGVVIGGSGGSMISDLVGNDVDLLISSDIKYHEAQFALENKISIIDLGHFESEKEILYELKEKINTKTGLDVFVFGNPMLKRTLFLKEELL